jgi:hypothetical protein
MVQSIPTKTKALWVHEDTHQKLKEFAVRNKIDLKVLSQQIADEWLKDREER